MSSNGANGTNGTNTTTGIKWKPTLTTNSYPEEPAPLKPLSIVIVGAGIGGLSAAVGLRRQGHHVSVSLPYIISFETNSHGE